MIVDSMLSADRYVPLHPLFRQAVEFLRSPDLLGLADGRYELDGDELVAIVVRKGGKSRGEAVLEAHARDIDIHVVLEGRESMGWRPVGDCERVKSPYDEASDCIFFEDRPALWAEVPAGSFAIFFPADAHAAMVSEGLLHKVVLKVRDVKEAR